jgi:hypothetical protein
MADLSDVVWRRTARCNNGDCVEVAFTHDEVGIRSSTDQQGPMLMFSRAEWTAFLHGVRGGEFDLDAG